uniref:RHS repeat-associated core domain-containing protein n=1 Tax=uncultured Bacteroides sp. TaxID=162156 RepID=UPI00280BEBA4
GNVEETNHYYPFGGIFASTGNIQPYKYNGKELDTKKGLNWYDYGARMYDATLGRWHVVDPMAEKYYSISPYVYCINNSIKYIDPTGEDVYGFDTNTGRLSLVEHTKDEFDRIKVGTFNEDNIFTISDENNFLDISKETLLGEHFDDISEAGIVFHEGSASEGIKVMEFLSFNSNIEFSAWAYKSNSGIGLSISPWALNGIEKRNGKLYMQSKDFYINSEKVGYLGDKYFNIHTHPASRSGLGGYGKPSNSDFKNILLNIQYPHYILSKKEGIIQYYPNKTWKKSFIR